MPVGFDVPALPGGIATTRVCGTPLPSYRGEVALPLFATQTKPVGLKAMPQAFCSTGSRCAAAPDRFDTSGVTT